MQKKNVAKVARGCWAGYFALFRRRSLPGASEGDFAALKRRRCYQSRGAPISHVTPEGIVWQILAWKLRIPLVSIGSISLFMLASANLTGCATFKNSYRVDDAAGFSNLKCPSNAGTFTSTSTSDASGDDYSPIDLCALKLAGLPTKHTAYELASRCNYGVSPTDAYDDGSTIPADPQTCKLLRNNLQDFIITHADKICAKHQAYIIANAAAWNIGTGFLANLFSGIGAVAGSVTTKAGLAGAAALSGGTRDLVDSEVYQKLFAAAIVKASDTERTKLKADILQKQTKSMQDYPIDAALDDVQSYHVACSFASGVQYVSQAVQRDAASYSSLLGQQKVQVRYR